MEDIQPDADLPEVVATACGEQVVMAQVLQMKTRELTKMAKDLKVEDPDDYRWAELVAVVLESHYEAGGRIAADCVVEVLPERYGMLRFHHNDYTRSDWDIYVSPSMVRRYNLKTGDSIKGFIRPPKEGEKLWALLKIEAVTGDDPLSNRFKLGFDNLTPLYPEERLHLETLPDAMASRIIDLLVPIGKGQRALVVAPPRAGKTVLLQDLARSVATNHPEAHLIVLLVDERPEEVTDMVRSVRGEVISSTFDEPAAPRPGGRDGDSKGQAAGGTQAGRRDPVGFDHPAGSRLQPGRPSLWQDPDGRCGLQRSAEAQALFRRRTEHRRGWLPDHHCDGVDRHGLTHGRGDL